MIHNPRISNFKFQIKDSEKLLYLVVIIVVAFYLVCFNVSGLDVGRDEGVHAFAAKTLAFEGHYALKDGPTFLDFDRRIAVGPTVIVPAALVFKFLGVSVSTIRVVPAIYFLLFMLCFYLLVKREFGEKTAFLAELLILSAQWPFWRDEALFNPIYRTLTGESAALFFLVLSLLLWKRSYISALVLGLAILTKYQFVLVVPPLLIVRVISCKQGLSPTRTLPNKDSPYLGAVVVTFLCFAPLVAWLLLQYAVLGPVLFWERVSTYSGFSGQAFALSFMRVKQNLVDKWFELSPLALKIYFTLPAVVFGWFYVLKNKLYKDGLKLFLIIFPSIWMFWYLFSQGYIRYEVPGLYFALIFLALLFIVSISETSYLKVPFMCMIALILLFGFYVDFREAKVVEAKSGLEMADFIGANVGSAAKIITSELDYNVDLFLDNKILYHTSAGFRSAASSGEKVAVPVDIDYILTKENDPSFEVVLSGGNWRKIYESGDLYLYRRL